MGARWIAGPGDARGSRRGDYDEDCQTVFVEHAGIGAEGARVRAAGRTRGMYA